MQQSTFAIEVVYALPEQQWVHAIDLPANATVADALAAVAELEPFAQLDLDAATVGVYGEVVERTKQLEAYDRVEIYRGLHQDPKTARRLRAKQSQPT